MTALSWNEGIYELERGVGLALCTAHQGAHVWIGWCQALQPAQPKRLRMALLARSLEREPTPRVEVDSDALAEGIALALEGLMRRRQEQRATPPPDGPATTSGTRVPDSPHRVRLD